MTGATNPTALRVVDDREQWLRAAYNAHGAEIYRYAARSLGDKGLAEEATQDTFVRAWRAADRFDDNLGSLRTWLFAIVRNVIIDKTRARSIRPAVAGEETDEPTAGDELDKALVAWQVEEALRRLSDEHRRVLIEVHYRGRPYQDVATELGVPAGTVKSRVYYALKALRLTLDEMGWVA